MRGASFAQVLDRFIDPHHVEAEPKQACPAEAVRRRAAGPSMTTAPIGGAPFMHRWGYVAVPLTSSPQARPQRALNAPMRAALGVLRSAGAVELRDDFLFTELKAAFRRLARSAHPDMHPRATEHEKRWLIAQFREIHEAYQTLASCPS